MNLNSILEPVSPYLNSAFEPQNLLVTLAVMWIAIGALIGVTQYSVLPLCKSVAWVLSIMFLRSPKKRVKKVRKAQVTESQPAEEEEWAPAMGSMDFGRGRGISPAPAVLQ